jgi:hypothetical protein
MKMHGILRLKSGGNVPDQVCVGSSPISGKPYWAVPGGESTIQPLLFREESYAQWCLGIAERKDTEAGETGWEYALFQVDMIGF